MGFHQPPSSISFHCREAAGRSSKPAGSTGGEGGGGAEVEEGWGRLSEAGAELDKAGGGGGCRKNGGHCGGSERQPSVSGGGAMSVGRGGGGGKGEVRGTLPGNTWWAGRGGFGLGMAVSAR